MKNSLRGLKKVICLIVAVLCGQCLYSQDIIITKDSKKIDGKVIEIGVENLKYIPKDIPTLEYVIPKTQVCSIVFEYGKVELFDEGKR